MRKRSYELVIPITSVGEFSFLFLFYHFFFPFAVHCREVLKFHYREFENFTVQTVFPVLILTNFNPFGSLVFLLVSCLLCVHSSLCSGTETLQADWKGLVLQLNKGVKSVCTATRWSPRLKSSRANRGFKGSPMPTGQ